MQYKIAVTNVNFDRNYDNVLRFNSKTERNTYFGIPAIFENSPTCNFAVSSLLETSVVVRYDAATDLKHFLMCNYAIVQNVNKADELYFYFINEARQESGSIITLQLELDIFQTFYQDISFSPCLIRRAHLDRWGVVDITEKRAAFPVNDSADNFMLLSEDVPPPPKRLTQRVKATPNMFGEANNSDNEWIRDHVRAWVYVYVVPTTAINIGTEDTFTTPRALVSYTDDYYKNGVRGPAGVMVYPVMDDGYALLLRIGNANYYWGVSNVDTLLEGISAYIYSIKISARPPLMHYGLNDRESNTSVYEYRDEGRSMVISLGSKIENTEFNTKYEILSLRETPLKDYEFYVNVPADEDYTAAGYPISDIIAAQHDPKYNPKMYNEQYREVNITDATGQKFALSQLKLGTYNARTTIYYNEPLTPDITRIYASVKTGDIYTPEAYESYTGLVSSADYSMPYSSDQLNEFLAQNKNFFEQGKYNAGQDLLRSGISAGAGLVNGLMGAGNQRVPGIVIASSVISAGASMANAAITYQQQIQNMEYTADNMRNAPDQLKNANGSAILNMSLADLGIYIDIYEALKVDQIRVNDVMHRFGFSMNAIGDIKNYDHVRHYFNYVQAEVEEILGDTPVSQAVRDRFKEAFAAGVRFWNASASDVEMYDFGPENYEERLVTS